MTKAVQRNLPHDMVANCLCLLTMAAWHCRLPACITPLLCCLQSALNSINAEDILVDRLQAEHAAVTDPLVTDVSSTISSQVVSPQVGCSAN